MTTVHGKGKPAGFKLLPEGEQVLHITNVKGLPRDNVSVVTMEMLNEDGLGFGAKFPQKYDLTSDGGYAAFYFLLKNGLGIDLDDGDEFDIDMLNDKYVRVDIVHKAGTRENAAGVIPTFANIKSTIGPAEPFGTSTPETTDNWED
jgi:hypothetical protein